MLKQFFITMAERAGQLITKQARISFVVFAYLLACYELLRLGFYLFNRSFFAEAGAGEIVWAFIYGLRFDISALLIINGVFFVLYNLPGNPAARWKWLRVGLLVLAGIFNLAFITLNLADYGYFPTIQRRLMQEIFMMPMEILDTLPAMVSEYYYLLLLLLILSAGFILCGWALLKRLNRIEYRPDRWKEVIVLILLLCLMTLGIRGGFQSRPIRPAHAFVSPHRAIGYLVLNSSFTILKSFSQNKLSEQRLVPEPEAAAQIKAMFCRPDEQMLDPQYPFLRRITYPTEAPVFKYNFVIIIMESWTGDYIGSIRGQSSCTPFFDSIAKEGMLFTNFLANGQRSEVAVTAILSSIPGFFPTRVAVAAKRSLIGTQSELNNFLGLGNILLKQGYATSFHHGAKTGSMGFDAFTRLAGFSRYFGKEDYPGLNSAVVDGTWGVWDEEFFQDAARRMDGFKPPFCSVIFSLTSHDPYPIPPHRQSLFSTYPDETAFQRVLRYSDYSLQQFFQTARAKPWFKDTVFIITGDHTHFAKGNNFHSFFNVPLLIYAPGRVKPQRSDRVGSQVDIIPTVLDILQISTVHSSMGRSLLDNTQSRYAVVTDGAWYAVFDDRFVLINDLEKTIGLYDYRTDPFFRDDLQSKNPNLAQGLRSKLLSYIQSAGNAIVRNRICRPGDVK